MINYFKLTSININITAASLLSLISASAPALTSRNLNPIRLDWPGLSTTLINVCINAEKQIEQHPYSRILLCIKEQTTTI